MLSRFHRSTIAVLLLVLWTAPSAAQDVYKVQPGDVLEFTVVALPNLHKMMRVSPDGDINVPLIGRVPVANQTLADVETHIKAAMEDAVYRQRVDGDELVLAVRPDEISLEIAEFRPVYVLGAVSRPGEIQFRAGMTVRRAIAMTGGLAGGGAPAQDQTALAATINADYGASVAQYIAAAANLARLTAELSGSTTIASGEPKPIGLPEQAVAQIAQTAQAQLDAQVAFNASEKDYIQASIQQNGQRIAVLREQQRQEQEGVEADTAEFSRIQQLASQQAVQPARVTDARRQLLMSSTRALGTKVELAAIEIRQADLIRSLQRFDEQRRISLLGDLRDATQSAATLRARIESLFTRQTAQAAPVVAVQVMSIVIYRREEGGERAVAADLSSIVQPGDAIEISYAEVSAAQ